MVIGNFDNFGNFLQYFTIIVKVDIIVIKDDELGGGCCDMIIFDFCYLLIIYYLNNEQILNYIS